MTKTIGMLAGLCCLIATHCAGQGFERQIEEARLSILREATQARANGDPGQGQIASGPKWRYLGQGPDQRYGHIFLYEGARQTTALFGGIAVNSEEARNVWDWDGVSWRRRIDCRRQVCPELRFLGAMAHSPEQGFSVLFGGCFGSADCDSTWLLKGDLWTRLTLEHPRPEPRLSHAMAYDPIRGKVVLFGGSNNGGALYTETWEFDVAKKTWTRHDVAGPSPRRHHSMTYHPELRKIIVFGGQNGSNQLLADFWAWNGRGWEAVLENNQSLPGPLSGHQLIAVPHRSEGWLGMLFGGVEDFWQGRTSNQTWFWSDRRKLWTAYENGSSPSGRYLFGMAYDETRNSVFLYGGNNLLSGEVGDVWEFR